MAAHIWRMPRSAYAARREALIADLCRQIACGANLHVLSRQPGMPHWQTFMKWQRDDPSLKARLRRAREQGLLRNSSARHDQRFFYDYAKVEALLAHVRSGESTFTNMVGRRPWPDRAVINYWKRSRPEFGEQLAAAIAMGRKVRRLRPRWPYDEAVGDRIVIRLRAGETLPDVCRDPAMPGKTFLGRWRRDRPDFDAAIRLALRHGHRRNMALRRGDTPKMKAKIARRLAMGAAMSDLRGQPGVPDPATIYAWMRRDPAFAAQVEQARDFRDWTREDALAEQAMNGDPRARLKLARIARERERKGAG